MKTFIALAKPIGFLLIILSGFIFLTLIISILKSIPNLESLSSFLIVGFLSLIIGIILFIIPTQQKKINYFDGCILVTLCWVIVALLGSLIYYIALPIAWIDAVFESFSGFTTTGATIFKNIEELSSVILLWRSVTQWIGGMGIIVLVVAIIPYLNFTNTSIGIYQAEAPGPATQKLTPNIKQTAKFLWSFYLILTLILFIIFIILGMEWFDALNHSFTTIATGGFSTKNQSIAYFNSDSIEIVMIIFMIFCSINFSLHYKFLNTRSIKSYLDNELFFFLTTIIITIILIFFITSDKIGLRSIIFTVVSLFTTAGFTTIDYEIWLLSPQLLIMFLMGIGGCSGSTSGGIKVLRIQILIKHTYKNLSSMIHPRLVKNIKINKQSIDKNIISKIISFMLLHVFIVIISTILVSIETDDFLTAFSSVLASIGNIGPAFGTVGPTDTFAALGWFSKLILSINMLMGRLELFTVIILFIPNFWQKHNN